MDMSMTGHENPESINSTPDEPHAVETAPEIEQFELTHAPCFRLARSRKTEMKPPNQ
jgi:hypothetical protein